MEHAGFHLIVQRGRALVSALHEHRPLKGMMRQRNTGSPAATDGEGATTEMAGALQLALELCPGARPVGVVMTPAMARAMRRVVPRTKLRTDDVIQ